MKTDPMPIQRYLNVCKYKSFPWSDRIILLAQKNSLVSIIWLSKPMISLTEPNILVIFKAVW